MNSRSMSCLDVRSKGHHPGGKSGHAYDGRDEEDETVTVIDIVGTGWLRRGQGHE